MSITLSVVDGSLTVELPGRRGRVHTYRVEIVTDNPERFEVQLHKDDGSTVYTVLLERGWRFCDCAHFRCRQQFVREVCKHVAAVSELRDLTKVLYGSSLSASANPADETPRKRRGGSCG